MKFNYLLHLLWMVPVLLLQWSLAGRVFRRNLRGVFLPPLILGTYYVVTDAVAIGEGIWHFDPEQLTGIQIGPVPIEEVLFFYLTTLLVSQSLVMLLPGHLRR